MDHEWVKNRNRISPEYIQGIHEFIEVAKKNLDDRKLSLCPCNECINARWQNPDSIRTHLIKYGIDSSYTRWIHHGEEEISHNSTRNSANELDGDSLEAGLHDATDKGARKAMKSAKERLKVELNFGLMKAICNNAETFNNEIGYIVRKHCSLQYKEWRYVPEDDRKPLRERLLKLFDIDIEDEKVRKLIDQQMQKAWRSFRYKLHAQFKKDKGEEDPITTKANVPTEVKQADWEYLCDYWASDEFKERSIKNAASRHKRKRETRNGSKSTEDSSRPTHAQAIDELKVLKADLQSLKDDFMKMRQLLIDQNVLPVEHNSGTSTSTHGATPTTDHEHYSDSDDLC